MIFTRRGFRWMIDSRGFVLLSLEDDAYKGMGVEIDGERWLHYGWLDLI
jgi:hypothetical protein